MSFFLNWLYNLVSITPPAVWKYEWGYIALLVILWLLAIAGPWLPLHPRLKERLSYLSWYNAVIALVIFFFRWQRIPLFGMDIWRFLQELEILVWLGLILYYGKTRHQKVKLQEEIHNYKLKYLPQSHKQR